MAADRRESEFSRSEYRRQVAWTDRLRREGPFILSTIEECPRRGLVVDLGCGTGEHARFIAESGFPVVGIDASRDAMTDAAAAHCGGKAAWARADMRHLPLAGSTARSVLCLGNTIVVLGEDEAILMALREIHRLLVPGGQVLIQMLNYSRLRAKNVRSLPVNFRRAGDLVSTASPAQEDLRPDEELVYLRLMDFDAPKHVSFHVITLERRSGEDHVNVRDAVRRRLRSLEHADVEKLLGAAGFTAIRLFGDYSRSPFHPLESQDVIALARRASQDR